MNKKQAQYVLDVIYSESFDYAFRSYSSFEKVKDAQFHKLRIAYRKAADDLEQYVNDAAPEEQES